MDRNFIACCIINYRLEVALRKESVDRNYAKLTPPSHDPVALRKESVDRNRELLHPSRPGKIVALRKESVDRNF